jgi:hypothetical protein
MSQLSGGIDRRAQPDKLELRLDKALNGVRTVLAAGSSLDVHGQSFAQADLDAYLVKELQLHETPRTIRGQLEAAVKARGAAEDGERLFLAGLKAAVISKLGPDDPRLLQFGFKPRQKPRTLTAAEKVARAAKAESTRKARGTLGSRKRAAIHGQSPAVVVSSDGTPSAVLEPGTAPATPKS